MTTHATEIFGHWKPIRAEHDGMLAPDMALQKMELSVSATTYRIQFGHEVADEGSLEIEIEDAQLALVLTAEKGHNRGRIVPAIAQLRGDRLRICFGMNGARPTEFATSPGSNRYLVTYRRSPSG